MSRHDVGEPLHPPYALLLARQSFPRNTKSPLAVPLGPLIRLATLIKNWAGSMAVNQAGRMTGFRNLIRGAPIPGLLDSDARHGFR